MVTMDKMDVICSMWFILAVQYFLNITSIYISLFGFLLLEFHNCLFIRITALWGLTYVTSLCKIKCSTFVCLWMTFLANKMNIHYSCTDPFNKAFSIFCHCNHLRTAQTQTLLKRPFYSARLWISFILTLIIIIFFIVCSMLLIL